MYENEVNAAQFNTFQSNAAQTNISRVEQLQNLTGNMKLRAGLILADAAQKVARPTATNSAVSMRGGNKYAEEFAKTAKGIKETTAATKKLEEQTLKSLGLIDKSAKKTFLPFQKEIPKSLEDFSKTAQKAFEPTNTVIGKVRKSIGGLEGALEKLAGATFITKSLEILVNGFSKVRDEIDGVNSSLKLLNKTGIDSTLLASVKEFEDSITSLNFNNTEELATSFVAQYSQITQSLAQVGTLIPEELKKGAERGEDVLGGIFDRIQNMVSGSLKNTVTSADAIAATYTALQAGIGGGDNVDSTVEDTVGNTLKLVATQGGDANQIMELLVQTMTAFNMSANSSGEILGTLNELVNVGITSIPELSNGFGQLGVGASRAGVTFEDLASSMALLTLSGSNTFSAMTNLQNVFNKIASGGVTDRLAEMGVTLKGQAVRFDSASVSTKGFIASVQELNQALGGSQEKLQVAFGGDQEAIKGITGILKQNADQVKTISDKIASAGVKNLEEAFNIKIDNDKVLQFEQVLNRVSEIALKLGKILAPLFSKGLDRIEKTIDRIEYLTKNYSGLIIKIVELNLALKALSGAFGALIGIILQLAGAYGVYLVASGKLLKNFMQIVGMLKNQNAVLNQNNLLWNKNANIFQKILGVFGQLIGVYDLQSAGQTKISKAQEAKIALEAKQRAVQAKAHKKTMDELNAEKQALEEILKVKEGKTDNRNRNVFNEQKLLDRDKEVLTKKRDELNNQIYTLSPNSAEREEKVKQVRKINDRIVETDAIKKQNQRKIAQFEKLGAVDASGQSEIGRMRESAKTLQQRDPATLTRDERRTLKSYNKQITFYDDVEIGRRARDWNTDDEMSYREKIATKKYIDENENKPGFKRQVERRQRADGTYRPTANENLIKYYEGEGFGGLTRKQNAELDVTENKKRMKTLEKGTDDYNRAEKDLRRNERILGRYQDAKRNTNIRGTNLSSGKGFENSITSGVAQLIDDVTSLPAALQDVGRQVGQVTKDMKKNLGDMISNLGGVAKGIGGFAKTIFTTVNGLMGLSLGVGALIAGVFVVAEKQAQQAREMLEEAGLQKDDPDIISPLDALKKGLVDVGRWITDFVGIVWKDFKAGLKLVADGIMFLPKLILKGLFMVENGWNSFVNNLLNSGLGKILGFGNQRIDTDAVKKRQEADLANLDKIGKDIVDGFTKPLDDTGNAIERFAKDVTYAVTEANKDIARAKLRDRKEQNSFEMKQAESKLASLNTIGIGGKFDDVKDENGKIANLSTSLDKTLTKAVVTEKDLLAFSNVTSKTLGALNEQYKLYEKTAKENEKIDVVQRKDLVENIKLSDKQNIPILEEYITSRVENEQVNFGRKKENKVSLELTDKQKKLEAGLTPEQRKQIDTYIAGAVKTGIESDKANTYNDNLKDLTGILGTVQNLLKNRSDIGGSNNVDASIANKGLQSTAENLGKSVGEFAQSLSVLQNSKYTQEELVKLAQTKPEEYKKLVEESGAKFGAATQIFTEVQKGIPGIIEKLQQNAQMGFLSDEDKARGLTADTSKAQRFRETIDKNFNQKFIEQGYSKEDAQKFTDALLADQQIREQIFALEKDDSDKRIERYQREKQIYETLKQSELLVTKDVITKTQAFEEKALQESISFQKKRIESLQQSSDGLDPQIIKDAQNDLRVLEEQAIIQRINQKRELLEYESKMIMDIYDKRYAEIEEKVLRGEGRFTSDERIQFEAEKQQEILKLNVQTQMQLRELLLKEGKYNKETQLRIEKQIAQSRVQLLQNYIDEAKQRYDNLANKIQQLGETENNYLSTSINKLNSKVEVYDKINQLIEQQRGLADSAQSFMDNDANFIRNNLVSRRKQIEFEKQYYAMRKKALAEQFAFERQTLAIQKEQNKLLIERLKKEQEIAERRAKADLKIAVIKEEQVMNTSTDPAEIALAQENRKIAEINLEVAVKNRDSVAAQEKYLNNQVSIDEYKLNNNERQQYDELNRNYAQNSLTKTDDRLLTRQALERMQNGGYYQRPILETFTPSSESDTAQTVKDVITQAKKDAEVITKDLKNKKDNIDKDLGKPLGDIQVEQYKTQVEMLNELRILNGKQPISNVEKTTKTAVVNPTTSTTDIEKAFKRTVDALIKMSGKELDPKLIPTLKVTDTGKAGGYYYDQNNTVEINKEYAKDLASGTGDGFSVLVHELRHWMQDVGLVNGMMNTDMIKDPEERKWAKETGLAFSGGNAREEDAYAFQTNYDEMLQRIVGSSQLLKGAQMKENTTLSINELLQKQLKVQETIAKMIEALYGRSGAKNNPQKSVIQTSPMKDFVDQTTIVKTKEEVKSQIKKAKTIYVGTGYISPNVRNQLNIGAEGNDGRKTDPKTGLALDPAFGWTEEYMPLKKKQGDLNRETDRLWKQYHDKGTHTYEQVQKMAEKNVGWSEKDNYDNKWRLFDVEQKKLDSAKKNPKLTDKERTKIAAEEELLRLRRKDAEARQAGGYTMFDPKNYVMDDETRTRMNVMRNAVDGTGLILQPELDIIEQERKKGDKNNPYLLNQNIPSFKYKDQQGKILAGLNTKNNLAEKMSAANNTTNNKTESKTVNVTLSPKIEINIDKESDKTLAETTAKTINEHLFNIFNEVAYQL